MVKEQTIKQYATSNFFHIPHEYVKVYDLNKYIYLLEVSRDGKTITYRRMRSKKEEIKNG